MEQLNNVLANLNFEENMEIAYDQVLDLKISKNFFDTF